VTLGTAYCVGTATVAILRRYLRRYPQALGDASYQHSLAPVTSRDGSDGLVIDSKIDGPESVVSNASYSPHRIQTLLGVKTVAWFTQDHSVVNGRVVLY
jgi:hypothetical protein